MVRLQPLACVYEESLFQPEYKILKPFADRKDTVVARTLCSRNLLSYRAVQTL